jgi:hypothetical protein
LFDFRIVSDLVLAMTYVSVLNVGHILMYGFLI